MPDHGKTPERTRRSRDQAMFHLAGFAITKRHLVKFAIALVMIAALAVVYQRIDPAEFQARAREWPAPVIIATIVLLPMVGFPVSWLHLVAGLCFGFVWGLVVVLVTTVIHHFAGWALVRVLPRHTFKRFEPWEEKLAGAGHRDATLLGGLIPGMPYVVHLYVLPIIGTPLFMLCTLGVGVHTARAFVTILLGDQSGDLTPGRIAALAVYYAVIVGLCAWALRSLRRRLKKNGQKTPGAGTKDASVPLAPCAHPPRS
jgi:uncharacterized membrane protein YdjX (TVP38/TMEM64 family)